MAGYNWNQAATDLLQLTYMDDTSMVTKQTTPPCNRYSHAM